MKHNLKKSVKSLMATMCVCGLMASGQVVSAEEKEVPQAAKDGLFYMWLFDEGVAGHQFEAIERMAASAMTVTRLLKNNLRELTPEDAEAIYKGKY